MTTKRLIFSFIGLLCVCALVWFAGPLLAVGGRELLAGTTSRFVVMFVLVLAWALNLVRKAMTAKSANEQLAQGIAVAEAPKAKPGRAASAEERRAAEEVAVLRDRFQEAVTVLRKTAKTGSGNLYELPWYIIIGPPGSGKTTALKNSGLEFPLADKFGTEALRGIGGTRNCDWWFTDEAILLDTAGRYVTQDSDQAADKAAWEGFLALLKRHRKRRPINGILVAISLQDLMLLDAKERDAHVRAIKGRIQELNSFLGFRFPVYVLFTKCDLVAGFMEFFDDLGREERTQVWGVTFPIEKPESVGTFAAEFDALLARVNDRLLARLDNERDTRRRALIYGFPQQMATLKASMTEFLTEVFKASRYDAPPVLRGIYFTSGTQEGTPIDRVMGSVARSFGLGGSALGAFRGQGRSYFVTDLFKKVIFPEAELVGTNRRIERGRTWLQRFAYASAVAAILIAAGLWSTAFVRNQDYVRTMDERVDAFNALAKTEISADASWDEILQRFDALHQTTEVYRGYTETYPLWRELGMYQGRKLGGAAENAYLRELNRVFAPRIAARIGEQLRERTRDTDFLYAGLKAYLMLGSSERLDPEYLKLWVNLDWERAYAREPDKAKRLAAHLDALLSGGLQPLTLDENLITAARLTLNRVPLAELIYARVKRDALADDNKPFVPAQVLGTQGAQAFVRASGAEMAKPIPGFFTYRGYYEVFQTESKSLAAKLKSENWVLANDRDELSAAELARLDVDVGKLYFAEYGTLWKDFVNDLRIVPFRSPDHGLSVLEVLSGRNSPLRTLLEAIEQNTTLTRSPIPGGDKLTEKVSEKLQSTKDELKKLLGADAPSIDTDAPLLPGEEVERRFADLASVARPDKNGVKPIDAIIEQLSRLYSDLDAIASSEMVDPAKKDEPVASSRRIKETALGQPEPLKSWLLQLSGNTTAVAGRKQQADAAKKVAADKKTLVESLNNLWRADILPFCQKAIASRYPIRRDAVEEATLRDFGRFFGPGGMVDAFVSQNLKPFIDSSADPWRWRAVGDIALDTSPEVLRQLQTAAMIRDTYFVDGGQMPTVEFALKPIALDKNATTFALDIGGQRLVYQHGPSEFRTARWPVANGSMDVRMAFEAGGQSGGISKDGPWALYRLLDQMRVDAITADRLVVTFALGGYTAQYEIRATSVVNPFRVQGIQSFQCPPGF